MTPIFVYGTLKREESRGSILEDASRTGDASYRGRYSVPGVGLLDLNAFPGMIKNSSEESEVAGEIWLVSTEVLESIDMIEGHPDFFMRKRVYAFDQDKQPAVAEAYFFSEEEEDLGSGIFSWDRNRLSVEEPEINA